MRARRECGDVCGGAKARRQQHHGRGLVVGTGAGRIDGGRGGPGPLRLAEHRPVEPDAPTGNVREDRIDDARLHDARLELEDRLRRAVEIGVELREDSGAPASRTASASPTSTPSRVGEQSRTRRRVRRRRWRARGRRRLRSCRSACAAPGSPRPRRSPWPEASSAASSATTAVFTPVRSVGAVCTIGKVASRASSAAASHSTRPVQNFSVHWAGVCDFVATAAPAVVGPTTAAPARSPATAAEMPNVRNRPIRTPANIAGNATGASAAAGRGRAGSEQGLRRGRCGWRWP